VASPSPRQIVSAVRTFARRHELLRPGPIVLAVSGGTDSTALALILDQIKDDFGLVLHVAHFDHRTRPKDAAKDAQYVADLAARIGAPIRVGRAQRKPKSEDEAREQRYAFLRRVANDIGATAIATGHTMDDQAETVLLHLTRGSGLAGVSGMRPLRDGIARPLLAIARVDTTAICRAARIKPREDPSNRSVRFARNRVRRNVLPELAKLNPQVRAALARFAEAAAEATEQSNSAQASGTVTTRDGATGPAPDYKSHGAAIDAAHELAIDIARLPNDLGARGDALVGWWRERTGRALSTRHRDALTGLLASSEGSRSLDLPGGTALREYGLLSYVPRTEAQPNAVAVRPVGLKRGEEVIWHGWRITSDMATDGLPFTARVDDATASKLTIRARRPGDRVVRRGQLQDIARRGKLQDVFVDAKVPARRRDNWPLFVVEQDVIWVPGITPPPDVGSVVIGAGPVGERPMKGEDLLGNQTRKRRVASMSEARRTGGNRGPR